MDESTLSRQSIIDKLLKVKALSEAGASGEREAARTLLISLMDKYGITDGDLDIKQEHCFKYKKRDPLSKKLLNQIIYSVMGDYTPDLYKRGKHPEIWFVCSKSQAVEIEAKYNFYYPELRKDVNLLCTAFIMKNHLYPPKSLTKDNPGESKLTAEDIKAFELSHKLSKREFFVSIGSDNRDDEDDGE